MEKVKVFGETFEAKEVLKKLGARWDAEKKCWWIDKSKVFELQKYGVLVVSTSLEEVKIIVDKQVKCSECEGAFKRSECLEVEKGRFVCFECASIMGFLD